MFSVAGEESLEDKKLTKAERLRLAKQSLKQRLGMALDSSLEGAAGEDEGGEGGAGSGGGGGIGGGVLQIGFGSRFERRKNGRRKLEILDIPLY